MLKKLKCVKGKALLSFGTVFRSSMTGKVLRKRERIIKTLHLAPFLRQNLCRLELSVTHFVDPTDFKLKEIHQPLPLSYRTKDICHHTGYIHPFYSLPFLSFCHIEHYLKYFTLLNKWKVVLCYLY